MTLAEENLKLRRIVRECLEYLKTQPHFYEKAVKLLGCGTTEREQHAYWFKTSKLVRHKAVRKRNKGIC